MKTINALISYDKSNDLYTIFSIEPGGSIVSDNSLEKAKDMFKKGMELFMSVTNILNHKTEKIGKIIWH